MSEILFQDGRTTKHKAKDSVFTALFKDVNNVFRLYRELHPEDTVTTVDDIEIGGIHWKPYLSTTYTTISVFLYITVKRQSTSYW